MLDPGTQARSPPRWKGQNQKFMIAPKPKPQSQPKAPRARTSARGVQRRVARPSSPADAPNQARVSIWNGSHGPMPPVMTAETAIALSPRSIPKRGPNAAPARIAKK